VGVVAVFAGHLAFNHRHVGSLAELGALLLVTGQAGLGDACLLHEPLVEKRAIGLWQSSSELVGGVNGSRPVHALDRRSGR